MMGKDAAEETQQYIRDIEDLINTLESGWPVDEAQTGMLHGLVDYLKRETTSDDKPGDNRPQPMQGGADCTECHAPIEDGEEAVCLSTREDPNGEAWAHPDCIVTCGTCGEITRGRGWWTDEASGYQEIICETCLRGGSRLCSCGHPDFEHIAVQDGGTHRLGECGHVGNDGESCCSCGEFLAGLKGDNRR
jgi:hypothetical protein